MLYAYWEAKATASRSWTCASRWVMVMRGATGGRRRGVAVGGRLRQRAGAPVRWASRRVRAASVRLMMVRRRVGGGATRRQGGSARSGQGQQRQRGASGQVRWWQQLWRGRAQRRRMCGDGGGCARAGVPRAGRAAARTVGEGGSSGGSGGSGARAGGGSGGPSPVLMQTASLYQRGHRLQ
jgi:hypothetical protein